MHKDAWLGGINLNEGLVKLLCQMFKCTQCRSNDRTLPPCQLMKNWIIKKKQCNDTSADSDTQSWTVGGVNSVLASDVVSSSSVALSSQPEPQTLVPIVEESEELYEEQFGTVEFDLLEDSISLNLMTISRNVTPYCDLKVLMGSVCSVVSSQVIFDCHDVLALTSFHMIIYSGCTQHMIPFKKVFITHKPTPHFYVILVDKSKVECLGIGTTSFYLNKMMLFTSWSSVVHYCLSDVSGALKVAAFLQITKVVFLSSPNLLSM